MKFYERSWFQSSLTIIVILLSLVFWLEGKKMYFWIKLITTAIFWIIIFIVYHYFRSKSLRKQIRQEFDKKIEEEVKKEIDKRKIDDFRNIMKMFEYLLRDSEKDSFICVFNNIGQHLPKLILKIEKIRMNFLTFKKDTENSNNLSLLNEGLKKFIKKVEDLSREFGDKRKDWFDNYDLENLDNLIINYEGFIKELNSFSVKKLGIKPKFRSLRWLLLRKKQNKNDA